ncbi:BURP domain-containing protein 3-like [Dioscorea cayenensis subsp. rotundata]|uniref:BURP domain-containing protein 3-like n=1 Tax=Dioscorea cayennensis subsp. rotundata TaxID=55577 RepID=A0AB40C3Z0_DIOCR|nr:BURP domain-containing protein 3-like [Dioscorea cayenensis subsp. rotundata]
MDAALVDAFINEYNMGLKVNETFISKAYDNIVDELAKNFNIKIEKNQNGMIGFTIDPITQIWMAKPEVWNDLIKASSTTVKEKNGDVEVKKTYSVDPIGVRVLGRDKLVVACHWRLYLYTVFFSHTTRKGKSKVYTMAWEGNDWTKVEAIAVCHLDTSKWNPKHLAFQVLMVKPGSVPACHFMPEDNIMWIVRK